jgi:hypothetical protein
MGKQVAHPRLLDATFKKAPKSRPAAEKKMALPFDVPEDQALDPDSPEDPF